MTVERKKLVKAFAESVGRDKAREIVKNAASEAGVTLSHSMEDEDAIATLEEVRDMDDTTSYVHIVANTLITKIRSGNL